MNKLSKLTLGFALLAGVLAVPSCKDGDEPDDPNKPENVDPSKPVNDPVGTVTMRMRNDNETKLGQMIVSPENNFSCKQGMIASLGPVAGLGNITDIPVSGWSDNVAVVIGNGYVYYDGNQYYRIYAVQWLKEAGTIDAILGVELKYQTPFKGMDEELVPESSALSFSDEGGTDEIRFTNTPVIPFTVESDADWCRVERWASSDKNEYFLYDGIRVTTLPNDEMEESRAKITVKTLYGKRTVISVTRSGQAPSILFPNGESEYVREDVRANGETSTISLTTNVEPEDFKAVSNVDWIVVDDTKRAVESRAMRNMTLRYTVFPNYTSARREGKIILSSAKGEKNSVMTFTQLPGEMSAQESFELPASSTSTNVSFTTTVGGVYTVASSASWCKVRTDTRDVEMTGSTRTFTVSIDLDPNTSDTDRKAIVSATAANGTLKAQTEIIQKGVSFENVPKTLYLTKMHQNTSVTLPIADLKVKSGAEWCQVHVNGTKLTILVDDASEDRVTTISFENLSAKITVDQSKYAVGDVYSEKGVEGIVCIMDGETRLVRSEKLGTAAYSTESFSLGASDRDNGMLNMTKVKQLSSWKKYYPAFLLCDELNVNGITGWYLPAMNENIGKDLAWSSTEGSDDNAYYFYGTTARSSNKSTVRDVYAVHRFVK